MVTKKFVVILKAVPQGPKTLRENRRFRFESRRDG